MVHTIREAILIGDQEFEGQILVFDRDCIVVGNIKADVVRVYGDCLTVIGSIETKYEILCRGSLFATATIKSQEKDITVGGSLVAGLSIIAKHGDIKARNSLEAIEGEICSRDGVIDVFDGSIRAGKCVFGRRIVVHGEYEIFAGLNNPTATYPDQHVGALEVIGKIGHGQLQPGTRVIEPKRE